MTIRNGHRERSAQVTQFLRSNQAPDPARLRLTLSELRSELQQVERMIRLLEWASIRPSAHHG